MNVEFVSYGLMKRLFLTFFLMSSTWMMAQTTDESSKPNNPIQYYAESMLKLGVLRHAPFSFYVKNLETDECVADVNGDMSMPAASTMKLVTTAAAIKILGSNYHFETQIAYSGEIDTINCTLNGNLYVIGGGDPTLGSKYYTDPEFKREFLEIWAEKVYEAGIHHINGRVIVDGSIYKYQGVPSGWSWSDLGNYYGAGPSGIVIFDNLIELHYNTGANVGDSTYIDCMEPYIPNVQWKNNVTSAKSSRDNAYVFGAPYSNYWYIDGSLPMNSEDFVVKAAMPDPEMIMAVEFDQMLEQHGVHVKYYPSTNRLLSLDSSYKKLKTTTIHTHKSPSLLSIINLTNRYSVNLFAEQILCQLSVKRYGYGSTYNGALVASAYWKSKIDASALFMTDGSGLSRSNAVSAHFYTDMLDYMKSNSAFKNSLAIAGKSGTMSNMCRGTAAYGRVIGKSGTMTRMKAYAGYVNSKTGKKLSYAMIINNYNCYTSTVKKHFEKLMVKMAEY